MRHTHTGLMGEVCLACHEEHLNLVGKSISPPKSDPYEDRIYEELAIMSGQIHDPIHRLVRANLMLVQELAKLNQQVQALTQMVHQNHSPKTNDGPQTCNPRRDSQGD